MVESVYTDYTLKARKVGGSLLLTYKNGQLWGLTSDLGVLSPEQLIWLNGREIWTEEGLESLGKGFTIEAAPRDRMTVSEKVVLFRQVYKEVFHETYRGRQNENANLKHVKVSRELLRAYFGNTSNYPFSLQKTVADYCKLYDAVARLVNPVADQGPQFPTHWDARYNSTLQPQASMQYKAFLVRECNHEIKIIGGNKIPVKIQGK